MKKRISDEDVARLEVDQRRVKPAKRWGGKIIPDANRAKIIALIMRMRYAEAVAAGDPGVIAPASTISDVDMNTLELSLEGKRPDRRRRRILGVIARIREAEKKK